MKTLIKIILEIRDYIYLWLVKTEGKDYALREYEFRLSVFFVLYYFALLTALILICYPIISIFQVSSDTDNFLKYNPIAQIFGGLILLSPYYFISKKLISYLAKFPIDLECNDESYKRKRNTTIIIFISGIISIPLIGAISNYLRLGHF